MNTGEIIKDMLNRTGKSQADLARYLGVNPNTVNLWMPKENKKAVEPSKKNLKKIAEFFQVSVDVIEGKAGAYESEKRLDFIESNVKKKLAFENFLEILGYKIETYERNNSYVYHVQWIEDGRVITRYIQPLDFDRFFNKLEGHIKIEIENLV